MINSIGQSIKRLRRERDMTQEKLAELLGVTSQAVSKWENEAGLPDISQIVPLAACFNVTTDTLFGLHPSGAEAAIEEVRERINSHETTNEERIELWRNLQNHYPNNTTIMTGLARAYLLCCKSEYYALAAEQYEKILEKSTDVKKRLKALSMLCFSYYRAGDVANAIRVAKLCGPNHISSDALLVKIDGYENRNEVNQNLLAYCIEEAAWCILRQSYQSDNDAIFALRKALSLLDTVYYDKNHAWISYVYIAVYIELCKLLAKIGDYEAMYQAIEDWFNEAVFEDNLPLGEYDYTGNILLSTRKCHHDETSCANYELGRMLEYFEGAEFEKVRDDERFRLFLDKVKCLIERN